MLSLVNWRSLFRNPRLPIFSVDFIDLFIVTGEHFVDVHRCRLVDQSVEVLVSFDVCSSSQKLLLLIESDSLQIDSRD